MPRLTPRQNILATLQKGSSEWIPIIGHFDSYNRPGDEGLPGAIKAAADDHGWWSGHAGIEYARHLGITVAAWTSPPLIVEQTVCETATHTQDRDTILVIHTPQGDLREVICKAESGAASYRISARRYIIQAEICPRSIRH